MSLNPDVSQCFLNILFADLLVTANKSTRNQNIYHFVKLSRVVFLNFAVAPGIATPLSFFKQLDQRYTIVGFVISCKPYSHQLFNQLLLSSKHFPICSKEPSLQSFHREANACGQLILLPLL